MPHSPTHSSCHPSISGAGGASLCSRPVILTCAQFMCCAELDPYSFVLSSVTGELGKRNTASHNFITAYRNNHYFKNSFKPIRQLQ